MKVSTLSLWLPPYFLFAANLVYLLTSTCKFALANQVQTYIWPAIRSCLYHHLALSKSTAPSRQCRRHRLPPCNRRHHQAAGFNSSWENRQVSSFLLKLYWYMAFELFIQGLFWWRAEEAILHVRRWVLCMEKSLFRLYNIHALYIVTSTPLFFKTREEAAFLLLSFLFQLSPWKIPLFLYVSLRPMNYSRRWRRSRIVWQLWLGWEMACPSANLVDSLP